MNALALPSGRAPFVVRPTALYAVAFLSLRHLLHEAHEFGHMAVGRLVCGEWGTRDFNNVQPIAEGCHPAALQGLLVSAAGPASNYLVLWLGAALLLTARTARRTAWGLTLVFASFPFARLFTALVGGGDEMLMARALLANPVWARMAAVAAVLTLITYPLLVAYKALRDSRYQWQLFVGFLVLPLLWEGAAVLGFGNFLLKAGVLEHPQLLGAPALVWQVLGMASLVFVAFSKYIAALVQPAGGVASSNSSSAPRAARATRSRRPASAQAAAVAPAAQQADAFGTSH